MSQLVFFLEEPSAKAMLQGFLPKILPNTLSVRYVVFDGKQDLEKQLLIKLRGWLKPECLFVVMRDKDSGDCMTIKQNLVEKCIDSGKPEVLVRIACHELEAFYLGDLSAVACAIGPKNLAKLQSKAKFRNPDKIASPKQELKGIAPQYQPVSGSRAIGALLNPENNQSISFNALVSGIRRLVG